MYNQPLSRLPKVLKVMSIPFPFTHHWGIVVQYRNSRNCIKIEFDVQLEENDSFICKFRKMMGWGGFDHKMQELSQSDSQITRESGLIKFHKRLSGVLPIVTLNRCIKSSFQKYGNKNYSVFNHNCQTFVVFFLNRLKKTAGYGTSGRDRRNHVDFQKNPCARFEYYLEYLNFYYYARFFFN